MSDPLPHSAFLDAAPDAIFVADAEGRIEFASRRGIAMLGRAEPAELIGRSIRDFVDHEDVHLMLEMLRDARHGPTEMRIHPQGGTALWTEANAERIAAEDGRASIVLVLRDVSRRKRAEEELLAAKAEAEEAAQRLVRSLRALEREAATDGLTGLWNRRQLEQVMAVELARCRRYTQVASLVLLDVDHFKELNDRFGHDAGDRALSAIGKAIARTARSTDTPCRWGGEEFAVLAPGVSAIAAVRLADRIREEVARTDCGVPAKVTLSAGVAQLDPTESMEQLLKRVDLALYQAKRAGRNRVDLASGRGDSAEHRLFQLVWDPTYECGDPLIDGQHRQMFALGNAVMDEAMSGAPREVIRSRLAALLAHTVSHFSDEEQFLERVGFGGRSQHMALHRALVDEAVRLDGLIEGGRVGVQELLNFLVVRVVHDHLLGADVAFFPTVAASSSPDVGRKAGPAAGPS